MTMAGLRRIRKIGVRAARLAPHAVARPRLVPLVVGGVHPEHYLRLDAAWLKEAGVKTVLDIGANTGQFASAMRAVLPGAVIYAFEPLPHCRQQLETRFAGAPNFRTLGVALGEQDGQVDFHQNMFSQSSSVLDFTELHRTRSPWATQTQSVQVPMQRLDSLLPELDLKPAVFIKIDVQGYEDRVLKGGEQVVREAKFVLIETAFEPLYEAQATFATVYGLLTDYGFRFAGNLVQTRNSAGEVLFADALFVSDRR